MKVILIDSFYPINSRNQKIVESLRTRFPGSTIDVATWNRENRLVSQADEQYFMYNKYSPSGQLFKKLLNLYGYYVFLKQVLSASKFDVIIASHWDVLMMTALLKNNKQALVYENLDIPTSYNRIILRILQVIEKWALLRSDAIIFASRFFEPLYEKFSGRKFVIENKPLNLPRPSISYREKNTKQFVVSYIGLVRYFDIMKNLVDAVARIPNIKLKIHGDGPDLLALKEYSRNLVQVEFTGRYEQYQLPELYATSDLVWATYPNKDYNVKYAISNKFHESIAFQKPCVFANRTKLGDLISEQQIGLVVDPYSSDDIYDVLNRAQNSPCELEKIRQNLQKYSQNEVNWNEQFDRFADYIKSISN